MPYIKTEDRAKWEFGLAAIYTQFDLTGVTPGDLNYLITKLAHFYMKRKGLSYTHLNDVVGAMESAKAEFQRRVVAAYENEKIKSNGDV